MDNAKIDEGYLEITKLVDELKLENKPIIDKEIYNFLKNAEENERKNPRLAKRKMNCLKLREEHLKKLAKKREETTEQKPYITQ